MTMPKWKKDAKEFTVGVNYHEVRGYQSSIPKPVMETLGQPNQITFIVEGNKVEIKAIHEPHQLPHGGGKITIKRKGVGRGNG